MLTALQGFEARPPRRRCLASNVKMAVHITMPISAPRLGEPRREGNALALLRQCEERMRGDPPLLERAAGAPRQDDWLSEAS
jgi:hypothetical protein